MITMENAEFTDALRYMTTASLETDTMNTKEPIVFKSKHSKVMLYNRKRRETTEYGYKYVLEQYLDINIDPRYLDENWTVDNIHAKYDCRMNVAELEKYFRNRKAKYCANVAVSEIVTNATNYEKLSEALNSNE